MRPAWLLVLAGVMLFHQPAAASGGPPEAGIEAVSVGEPIRLVQSNRATELEPKSHEVNKILNIEPLYLGSVLKTASGKDLQEEANYDQSINLHDALLYALTHGLPLKISKEAYVYQHFQTLSNLAGLLPNFGMSLNLLKANIFSGDTYSWARQFTVGVSYPVFQGGQVLYSILSQRYREKGWEYAYKATISDVFLDIYTKYTNLILDRVLLQTYAKTVEADQQQLAVNQSQLKAGTGTRFSVMQTESQLSADMQSLLQQEVTLRQAALALNLSLNFPMSVNLVPVERTLSEAPLFDDKVKLSDLLKDALHFNPSLHQYEMFRLTAQRQVNAASAGYYPTISFFTLFQNNSAGVKPFANSAAVGGIATSAIANSLNTSLVGRVSNNALGQQQSFSPTAGSTSTQGANTAPQSIPAASGGTPIAVTQSGSLVSSGAVAPSILGGGGGGTGSNQNGALQAPAGIFPGVFRDFIMGFSLSWALPNLGTTTFSNIMTTRVLARQALLQCNQELDQVLQQIRGDYLAMLSSRSNIDNTAYAVASSAEELRLAQLRLKSGTGTNLEVLQARKDYVTALTNQAQSIVASNLAQAQLLHDMGMMSVSTLVNGYKPGLFIDPTTKKKKSKAITP